LLVRSLSPDLSKVTARKNLNETAFFFPHLLADDDGVVKMEFTMPEALTEWKFLGFAHDKQLRAGFLTDKVVTAKDLMVEPNPPRFVREGDAIEFTVKVSNQTDRPQAGKVRLTFADAATLKSVDDALGNRATEQSLRRAGQTIAQLFVAHRRARRHGFPHLQGRRRDRASQRRRGRIPAGAEPADSGDRVAAAAHPRQGDQAVRVQETPRLRQVRHAPQPVADGADGVAARVVRGDGAAVPDGVSLRVQRADFNRLYANALARHIANSDPKIRRIFDLWKGTPALDSPLEKNQDLKSVMLEETPWLRQATNRKPGAPQRRPALRCQPARRRNRARAPQARRAPAQRRLVAVVPRRPPSEYITSTSPPASAGCGTSAWTSTWRRPSRRSAARRVDGRKLPRDPQRQPKPEDYVPSHRRALPLRPQLLPQGPPDRPQQQEAVDFFLGSRASSGCKVDCRRRRRTSPSRCSASATRIPPPAIMKSLKERSVSERGDGHVLARHGAELVVVSRADRDAGADDRGVRRGRQRRAGVEDCKVWLLKQKQTQDWKTTKATADAVYACCCAARQPARQRRARRGRARRRDDQAGEGRAGTGFYEQKFVRGEIKPAMGRITVKKVDDGVSWGSVHWQYLEDMSKVTPHEGTPLKLKKTLFTKETPKGPGAGAGERPAGVGDELVVRIELRVDRDMEYVHLKDQRGSGTEPVNVLSRYKYQDGLAYYESTRDTASHFFIDYLPKGVRVRVLDARPAQGQVPDRHRRDPVHVRAGVQQPLGAPCRWRGRSRAARAGNGANSDSASRPPAPWPG
jgi:hypothetical protein